MKRTIITKTILAILLLAFVALAVGQVRHENQVKLRNNIELKSNEARLIELDNKYQDVLNQKTKTKQQKDDQAKKIRQLEKEKARLERQLISKRNEENGLQRASERVANTVSGTNTAYASENGSGGCTNNPDANFIYMKESGCLTSIVNPIGCKGLGQSCPASKIAHCGNDFSCQHAWFSNYAQERYGGWAGARAFWEANSWW